MFKQIVGALFWGIVASFAFLGVSAYFDELGFSSLAYAINWPNALLQSLVPPHNIGTAEHPFLEGSPLNDAAFFVSVPLAALVYAVFIFILWRWQKRVP